MEGEGKGQVCIRLHSLLVHQGVTRSYQMYCRREAMRRQRALRVLHQRPIRPGEGIYVHSLTFHALTEEQHGKDGNHYTPLPCLIRVGYTTLPPGRTPLTSVHPLPDRVPITQVQHGDLGRVYCLNSE